VTARRCSRGHPTAAGREGLRYTVAATIAPQRCPWPPPCACTGIGARQRSLVPPRRLVLRGRAGASMTPLQTSAVRGASLWQPGNASMGKAWRTVAWPRRPGRCQTYPCRHVDATTRLPSHRASAPSSPGGVLRQASPPRVQCCWPDVWAPRAEAQRRGPRGTGARAVTLVLGSVSVWMLSASVLDGGHEQPSCY